MACLDWKVRKVSDGGNDAKKKQDSMINAEVSISFAAMDSDTEGKKMKARIKSTPSSINKDTDTSDESMFYITKDSEDDTLTDTEIDNDKANRAETKQITYKLLKILQLEKDLEAVNELQKKLIKIETVVSQSHSNRFMKKVVRPYINDVVERDNKSAGDTLDILSNLNDNKVNDVVNVKGHDVTEHKRLSFATNRQSIVLSRKELLRNIAKAQAALEKSRQALDDSDSSEVDNTLQFFDESNSDESLNEYSPLKKTAFGETLYMREPKEKVIPKCLKKLSKEMKELIERINLESVVADKSVLITPSIQCTKIQANLVTFSQTDFNSKLCFNPGSNSDLETSSSVTSFVASKTSKSISLRNLVTFSESLTESDNPDSEPRYTHAPVEQPEASMSNVLVFDHLNPLNNILLRPINYSEVHNYNPMKADERRWKSEQNRSFGKHYNQARRDNSIREFEVRTMIIQQQRFMPSTAQEKNQRMRFSPSYSVDTKELETVTDDITKSSEDCSQDRFTSNCNENITKAKKQMCSSSTDKHKHHSSIEVTPEVQRNSSSQKVPFKVPVDLFSRDKSLHSLAPEKNEKQSTSRNANSSKTRAKIPPKTKMTKPGQNTTVRQLIADYTGFDTDFKYNYDFEEINDDVNLNLNAKPESFSAFTQSYLSFSSSKNLNPMKNVLRISNANCQSLPQSKMQGMPSQTSWYPEPPPSNVLVFDYLNSLNNVLLSPINVTETHKYNPIKSAKTLCCSEYSRSNDKHNNQMNIGTTRDFEMQTVSTKQHPAVPQVSITQEENQRIRFSKPDSFNIEKQPSETENIKSSEISLHDHFSSNSRANNSKGKKQTNSPSTDKLGHLSFVQVTPTPITKMQKISSSPKVENKEPVELPSTDKSTHSMGSQKEDKESTARNAHTSKTRDKKSAKTTAMKPERTITVQQLIADYTGFDTGFKHNDYKKNVLGDVNSNLNLKSESFSFSQSNVTFTLSKTLLNEMNDILSTLKTDCQSPHQSTMPFMPSQVDWPPYFDSGVNVVAKIDMLPFMGSHECEWETSPADTWSFRLLNGQLRLTARLAHRVDNAIRTRVRGDTPVLEIAVNAVQHGRQNVVARMSLHFACETMRYMVSRAVCTECNASDIPPLLRRCANVVRVVLRWKHAMHDAKQHLAYTLDSAGNLSLKVANIPLRSIWKVTMRIGLVLDESSSVPCPRASYVRVLPIVSDVHVPAADVRRALMHTPMDWGHVPSTIWSVYRLLKLKKRDDFLILTSKL